MALPNNPQTRKEMYLSNMAGQGTALPSEPHTREEEYLDFIAKNGGGGGGTGDGDMKKSVYDNDNAVLTAGGIKPFVNTAISGKVDKVQGKGLSSNDYDDSAKAIVDNVTTALDGKVSKSNTAGLVKNDGTIDTTITGAVAANTSAVSAIKDGTNIDSFGDVETALAGKMPNYGIGIGLYVDSDTNQLRADAVTKAIKDSPKLITSGAVFSGLSPKYSTAEQEETDVDGQDKFPFYDNSASAKRHTTFGNIKAKLKEYFDSLYVAAVTGKGLSTNDYDNTEKAKVAGAVQWADAEKSVKKNLWNTDITNGTANVDMAVTHNSDKSIKLNGTTTAGFNFPNTENSVSKIFNLEAGKSYIFSTQTTNPNVIKQVYVKDTSSSGWRQIAEDTSNPKMTFTMPNTFYDYWVRLRIESGRQVNETFYPMIYEATILDDTYAPYIPDNTELFPRSEQAVSGQTNFADFTKTVSASGSTITINSDGFTCASSSAYGSSKTPLNLIVGKQYYATVKVTASTSQDARLAIRDSGDIIKESVTISGTGTYTLPFIYASGYYLSVLVNMATASTSSITVEEVMVSLSANAPYAPYAMTNKELTELETPIATNITTAFKNLLMAVENSNVTNVESATLNKTGHIVILNARINKPAGTVLNFNVDISSIFPYTPVSGVYGVLNSNIGAGACSFFSKQLAFRYMNSSTETYVDLTVIAVVKE